MQSSYPKNKVMNMWEAMRNVSKQSQLTPKARSRSSHLCNGLLCKLLNAVNVFQQESNHEACEFPIKLLLLLIIDWFFGLFAYAAVGGRPLTSNNRRHCPPIARDLRLFEFLCYFAP